MNRNVLVSDLQIPLHDVKLVNTFIVALADMRLTSKDMVAIVGDECDCTSISRHVRGQDKEYTDNLQHAIDSTHEVLRRMREAAPDAKFVVQRSNHTTTRLENYIGLHAPALSKLRGLDWASLMGYDELDIKLSLQPTPIAPGWVMMHGDEGRSATYAGGTALKLALQTGEGSVVCGHTHRLGLVHDHGAHSGRVTKHRFGFEVGHFMDMKKADAFNGGYLKYGGANWNQGFGLLYVDGKHVIPTPIPVVNGRFVVEGKQYNVSDPHPVG